LLPSDQKDTTVSEGREVHVKCYNQWKDGRKTEDGSAHPNCWAGHNANTEKENQKLSVAEVLEKLRNQWVEGTREEWIALAVDDGLSEADAYSLLARLAGNELFWYDRDGKTFWRWVRT